MSADRGFVHLHVHTHHSRMRSTVRIEDLVAAVAAQGSRAVAVTDEWSLAGVPEFMRCAREIGVQPIVGMEIRVRPRDPASRRRKSYALVLIARNPRGFRSLCELVGLARRGMWESSLAVDWDQLCDHRHGLLALSANVHGEIGALLSADRPGAATLAARALSDVFGRHNVHLEIQVTGEYNQHGVNEGQRQIAERLGLGLVVTNPVHYLRPEDALGYQVMSCIDRGRRLGDVDSPVMPSHGFFLRDPVDMAFAFAEDADALRATDALVERCQLRPSQALIVPPRPCWQRKERLAAFERAAREGLSEHIVALRRDVPLSRFEEVSADLSAALDWELDALVEPPEGARFLLAHRVVRACREAGIPVGPGRGPGVSAAVLYALGVTGVNPRMYDLLSERYLDPGHEPRPILLDIHPSQIDRVVECVVRELGYGFRVVRPARRSVLGGRGLVDGAMAALDLGPDEVGLRLEALTESWRAAAGRARPFGRPIARVHDRLQELVEITGRFATLDGCPYGIDEHESAFAVVDHPVEPPLPVRRSESGAGLVEYDPRSLVQARHAVFELVGEDDVELTARVDALLAERGGPVPGWDDCAVALPTDPAVQELLGRGNTLGISSLGDPLARRALTAIGPTDTEELMAAVALGRRGPIDAGLLAAYTTGDGLLGDLGPATDLVAGPLDHTRGVLLYQEQAMEILSSLARLDHGETWPIVRALGRGRGEELEAAAERFIGQASRRDVATEPAWCVWEWLGRWTRYTLSRASVASLALKACKLAWHKAHHPASFFAALLSSVSRDRRQVRRVAEDMRKAGVELLAPDVIRSGVHNTVEDGGVRLGLAMVRGVTDKTAESLVLAREEGNVAQGLLSWLSQVTPGCLGRAQMANLAASGALDVFGCTRAAVSAGVDGLITVAEKMYDDRETGQEVMFEVKATQLDAVLPEVEEWSAEQRAGREVEVLGVAFSI